MGAIATELGTDTLHCGGRAGAVPPPSLPWRYIPDDGGRLRHVARHLVPDDSDAGAREEADPEPALPAPPHRFLRTWDSDAPTMHNYRYYR